LIFLIRTRRVLYQNKRVEKEQNTLETVDILYDEFVVRVPRRNGNTYIIYILSWHSSVRSAVETMALLSYHVPRNLLSRQTRARENKRNVQHRPTPYNTPTHIVIRTPAQDKKQKNLPVSPPLPRRTRVYYDTHPGVFFSFSKNIIL